LPACSEITRLAAVRTLDAQALQADPRFEAITQVAQHLLDVPMISITVVDADHQWRVAFQGPLQRLGPLAGAVCPTAMLAPSAFVVPDLSQDPRFATSPYVLGDPYLRFYAGWPLTAPGGEPVGAFCAMDVRPRAMGRQQHELLADLAHWVQQELHRGLRGRPRQDALT
jgi:GAF domain-containing protein